MVSLRSWRAILRPMAEEPKRPKRGAGQGSVFRRADGKWIAQVSSGPRGAKVTRQRVRTTRHEASRALAELLDELRADRAPVSTQSLGAYLRSWLDESARPTISPNTYRGYDDAIALWSPIHPIALGRLTPEDIERTANTMTATKGKTTRPAAPKTVRNAQIMLRRALGQAEMRGHVQRNVARLVPLRRVPRSRPDPLTPERARAILAAVSGDRYEAAFALAMTGLRVSEALGLAWSDVDLRRRTVLVRYQLVGSGRRARRATLKTEASEAPVPLPAFVAARLRLHRMRQRHERPVIDINGGLVFVTPDGWAVNGSWLTKHFQALLTAAGLPHMTIHSLRHGAATLLMGAGVHPRVAQELLRHASSRTTMDIYSHVTGSQQREAADMLDQAVGGHVTKQVTVARNRGNHGTP